VVAAWGGDAQPAGLVADPRLAALGYRGIVPKGTAPTDAGEETGADSYAAHRTALGVPEAVADFAYGDVFPHDVDLDQLNGVDFTKGCFVGQEVVSRMQHRGTARRRIVQVRGAELTSGAEIVAGGQAIGTVGSVHGDIGLATIRLDRAAEAIAAGSPFISGGQQLELVVPSWATFDLLAPAS
jgi:folate-binding protein YgfZ